MKLLIIASNYPWPQKPYSGTFVREFVWELARQGHTCKVVVPSTFWDILRYGGIGKRHEKSNPVFSTAIVDVARPRYLSASAIRMFNRNTIELSDHFFTRAVMAEIMGAKDRYDAIYAHFFYPAGRAAAYCSEMLNIPFFIAHGDDDIDPWYVRKGNKYFEKVSGVIAVSKRNARFCIEEFAIPEANVRIFPNGIDQRLFYPRDRKQARAELGLPQDIKLIAFVGHYIERKGPHRLIKAVEGLERTKLLLIGEGPIKLDQQQVAFSGVVEHGKLPLYLSAADIFVLPTTGEGSCNAILEAMACGLPIISSNGDFNDDILNDQVSIRVDPLDIVAIRNAIVTLIDDDDRRQQMSISCLKWISNFSISHRVEGIATWLLQQSSASTH